MPSTPDDSRRLLIAGNAGGTHVGDSLLRAAHALGITAELRDTRQAYAGSRSVARINWWLRGRRPNRLTAFSADLVDACRQFQPRWMLATGIAPVHRRALDEIRRMGIETINYLTDDPWNPAFRSTWFLQALPAYDRVFSPRTRNLDDLRRAGCNRVEYLPFAADPDVCFPEEPVNGEADALRSDICFVGGADRDRAPLIARLIRAELNTAVYGQYWGRYLRARAAWRGYADPQTLRKATRAAAVSLCLVRRANRDGHTMRTFEVPHMGGCMLAEDTDEHRALFGGDDTAVVYFKSIDDAVESARALVNDPPRRRRLAENAQRLIVGRGHTYRDRLRAMVGTPS